MSEGADDGKKPNKRFKFFKSKGSEKTNEGQETSNNEQEKTTAHRDGTSRSQKPANVRSLGASSFSPMGTVAVKGRREVQITVTSEELEDREVQVNLDRTDVSVEYPNQGLNVLVKIEDQPSKQCIYGGKISRLTITEGEIGNEDILAHFANGDWIEKPNTFLANQVADEAIDRDNGTQKPDIARPISQDKDKGRSR